MTNNDDLENLIRDIDAVGAKMELVTQAEGTLKTLLESFRTHEQRFLELLEFCEEKGLPTGGDQNLRLAAILYGDELAAPMRNHALEQLWLGIEKYNDLGLLLHRHDDVEIPEDAAVILSEYLVDDVWVKDTSDGFERIRLTVERDTRVRSMEDIEDVSSDVLLRVLPHNMSLPAPVALYLRNRSSDLSAWPAFLEWAEGDESEYRHHTYYAEAGTFVKVVHEDYFEWLIYPNGLVLKTGTIEYDVVSGRAEVTPLSRPEATDLSGWYPFSDEQVIEHFAKKVESIDEEDVLGIYSTFPSMEYTDFVEQAFLERPHP